MKVTIVGGAGVVGSCTAFRIAQEGKASEIIILDKNRNLAEAHALDIEQAVVHRSSTKVKAGDIEDTEFSNFIVISVGFPQKFQVRSRSEFLAIHLPIVMEVVENLILHSPDAIWFFATSPVDPLTYLIYQVFSISRQKILGLNRNDTSRFRWAIARTLNVPASSVEAYVLGEHGKTQVPLFSHIAVDGRRVELSQKQIEQIYRDISSFYAHYKSLQSGRTAGWASAESIGDIFSGIASGDSGPFPASTPLEGEYGLSNVSLGIPLKVGPGGIQEIVEVSLTQAERMALEESALTVKEQIIYGQRLIEAARKVS